MLIRNYILYLALLVGMGLLVSCSDDDDAVEGPTKTDLLTSGEWKGDEVLLNGFNVALLPNVGTNANTFKTFRLTFKKDNTYTASVEVQGQKQTNQGTWKFNADETALQLDPMGELQLEKLTQSNLDVSTTISTENMYLIGQMIGVNPKLIEDFTGGKPVKTEMRLVK